MRLVPDFDLSCGSRCKPGPGEEEIVATPKEFDYVIVGAGSAGCVLASRLSADPDTRVLVLEAGPMDRSIYTLKMPAAFFGNLSSKRFNWYYHSEPEAHLNGRRLYYPRGRVVGGSSSISACSTCSGCPTQRWTTRWPAPISTTKTPPRLPRSGSPITNTSGGPGLASPSLTFFAQMYGVEFELH